MDDYDEKLRVTAVLRNGRRRFDPVSKARLVEACLEPGVSVAGLALEYGVNANLLRKWVKQHEEQTAVSTGLSFASPFIPVRVDKTERGLRSRAKWPRLMLGGGFYLTQVCRRRYLTA